MTPKRWKLQKKSLFFFNFLNIYKEQKEQVKCPSHPQQMAAEQVCNGWLSDQGPTAYGLHRDRERSPLGKGSCAWPHRLQESNRCLPEEAPP